MEGKLDFKNCGSLYQPKLEDRRHGLEVGFGFSKLFPILCVAV